MKSMFTVLGVAIVAGGLAYADSGAVNNAVPNVGGALEAVKVSELGAWAAQQVVQAPEAQRADVARQSVTAAIKKQPTATGLIVGAVARACPSVTAEVVDVAVEQQPGKVFAIVTAALGAAPSEVRGVVRSASRQAPKQYRAIGLLAAHLVPRSEQQILAGLGEGVPTLKNLLDQASGGKSYSISDSLAQVDAWVRAAARSFKTDPTVLVASNDKRLVQYTPPPGPPVIRPPYHPLVTTPTTEIGGSGPVVPPGGRGYAEP